MKNLVIIGLSLVSLYMGAALLDKQSEINAYELERTQIKLDLNRHINLIDDLGEMDAYCGGDSFERLYEWSHNEY